jgi:transcriptional regulator GlxA family with amidase domain
MKKLILASIILSSILSGCTQQVVENEKDVPYTVNLVDGRYNVAFLVMDGTFNTEFTAPFDIFQHTIFRENIKAMNVFTVAESLNPITTFEGVRILPDFSYKNDNLPKIDILVVPSAEHHLDTDLENTEMIDFVKRTAKDALYITSHCDGAFVLAKSGILDGIESTTFPGDIDKYKSTFPELTVHKDVFFVHDGRFITSSGGAKSFEAALYLTELLYGAEVARSIAGGLVIDWNLSSVPHIIVE